MSPGTGSRRYDRRSYERVVHIPSTVASFWESRVPFLTIAVRVPALFTTGPLLPRRIFLWLVYLDPHVIAVHASVTGHGGDCGAHGRRPLRRV